jgi:NAD(P)-dependent dehydrogenase (short-subunit alcohol dehydrogenase family)
VTISGKTVLITGANRGIGQALTTEALARGARRVYAGTRQPMAHPDDRVTPLSLDITSPAQISAAAAQVESLDMLINNAGIALPDDLTDPAVLERHLAVNLFGNVCRHPGLPACADPLPGDHRQRPVGELPCPLAAHHPGLLDIEGGRLVVHPVASRPRS